MLGLRLCGPKLSAVLKTFTPSPGLSLLDDRMVTLKIFLEGAFGERWEFIYTFLGM